ncbi:hypothetical protein [Brachyspira pilosicoli]|uniref:Uncharacterized protein n=1 Tax=Brachyspira pilosicoli TaxID=52584 RepID=A0A5C8EDG3_BRAPL|nr:hypothetical protein [Brachyspira pilosicoli]TXJ35806.1 hypothetical protein EPJ72_12160 [Brachyspira pilosicoli]
MKITLDMSVSNLLDSFDREFGITLGIYKGAKKSNDIKLFEIADPRKNQKTSIVIDKDTSVETLEAMFRDKFGIRVQVKDRDGNTVNQSSTLGGIRKLSKDDIEENERHKKISLTDDDEIEEENKEIKKEINAKKNTEKKKNKTYLLNIHSNKINKHVTSPEEKMKDIDKYYLNFQRTERYKAMLNLLSCIEESKLLYPDSEDLINHINEIKIKSVNISNVSIKKRRFAIFVLIIITIIFSLISLGIWGFDFYNKIKKEKMIESIIKDIDNLRLQKGSLMESGNIAEASAIDENISSKSEQINIIKNDKKVSLAYYSLSLAVLLAIILSLCMVRLNKFDVTSSRFRKEN